MENNMTNGEKRRELERLRNDASWFLESKGKVDVIFHDEKGTRFPEESDYPGWVKTSIWIPSSLEAMEMASLLWDFGIPTLQKNGNPAPAIVRYQDILAIVEAPEFQYTRNLAQVYVETGVKFFSDAFEEMLERVVPSPPYDPSSWKMDLNKNSREESLRALDERYNNRTGRFSPGRDER
jgi:hypothetical protein